ncbi:glucose-1-phosphate adenylyltransferase [Neobacillus notoginsengisoli]|uniref:Glucose-1-phosphate adenylyltransferase n=1 Tax=Neobacillus notoginsengisoli TaxID=1578198 RepID=A0A417YDP5_9BACI|nr:sugar phosphate nucleotidyltransferase [Neobacillus notoginsengisoli]RHW30739.1 glucose-1-phosphate adenylyltransferase [Neobacillus notoginsengisoli]
MKQLLGVIDAATYHEDLQDLLLHRPVAALPFAGRYRLIDFVLSSMVNSGISSVAIFPKFGYRSLMDHLGSGKNWDLNRKRDGLFLFPASPMEAERNSGIGCFSHYADNLDFFYRSSQEYTIISNSFTVINTDFRELLQKHLACGCDMTEVYKNGQPLNIYLLKTSLLIDLIESRYETGYDCIKDVFDDMKSPYTFCTYEYEGYARRVDTIKNYYKTSMELLDAQVWTALFKRSQPIFTKVKDEPPSRYYEDSSVKRSLVANGCQLRGVIENSIIARGVVVGRGAVIRNSIIMQKCQIGENCAIDSVILDKDVKVESGTMIEGSPGMPKVYRKSSVIEQVDSRLKSLMTL